jgi:putative ABC transport system substrate-binding protein
MQIHQLRRREFVTLFGGAALSWPLATHAQQPAMPVIGFLGSRSADDSAHLVASFRQGLRETGYVDGQNVVMEFRWAQGQYNRLPELAADLVLRQVTVMFASAPPGVAAAKTATATIPIVFTVGGDPVKDGFVASFNRPGGNATGVYVITTAVEAKRLQLLHELMPGASKIAYLVNPNFSEADSQLNEVGAAGHAMGLQVLFLKAGNEQEIDASFATLTEQRIGAILISSDPFFNSRPVQFVALAARYSIPAMYSQREFAAAGGLISYGTSLADAYRQAGVYVGRILKGEKPADLPVQQSTKVELIINLKTARTLGLTFPITLLGRADEVIE